MTLPRVGLALIEGRENAAAVVETIKRAEERGVPMVWGTLGPRTPDTPTVLGAAAIATTSIGLGTAIVPTYPRHPAVLASQTLAIAQLAPDRFRLGVGPSHRPVIQQGLGLSMGIPLEHLREYVTILRSLLWNGQIDFEGAYYTAHLTHDHTARVPIYVSALRPRAFEIAGQVADGAISWLCPISYLREQAAPALRRGSETAGRPAPRLVAQVPVVMSEDRDMALAAARPRIDVYGRLAFYAAMFQQAGYPVDPGGRVTDGLLEHLVVFGNDQQVRQRLKSLLGDGIDELALTLISTGQTGDEEERLSRIVASLSQG